MSLFYLLKWVEYFALFVMTAELARSEEAFPFFLKVFFLLGIAVACYGYWEHFFHAAKADGHATFETNHGKHFKLVYQDGQYILERHHVV